MSANDASRKARGSQNFGVILLPRGGAREYMCAPPRTWAQPYRAISTAVSCDSSVSACAAGTRALNIMQSVP